MKKVLTGLLIAVLGLAGLPHSERIKDLTTVQGVRENALIGYRLIVGLDGTGDQTMQTPFYHASLNNMLSRMGSPYRRAPICS